MASISNAVLCAIVATAFWSFVGYAVGRRVFPRVLATGAAPALGWAVHSAAALPILELTGFTPAAVTGLAALFLLASGALFLLPAAADEKVTGSGRIVLICAFAAAALLALAPAAAIAPKFSAGGVYLAEPIFDHSKIAIIDAMTRQGLPPVNPIFGQGGTAGRLAYYYLWHFSAAELALPLGFSGWEADIGLTWFTAFASLSLMIALAVWLAKDPRTAILVVALAAAASLRSVLGWATGAEDLAPFLAYPNGFAGWLFQSAWVPQHLMSASCAVTAMLLVARYAERPSVTLLFTLVLTVTAGFESSTYVGGVTFAIAAVAAAPVLLLRIEPERRLRFVGGMGIAAVLVGCLVASFLIGQLATVAARHDPTPVVIRPFDVLGDMFPDRLRHILDLPAYWLVELPIEFPASYLAGLLALFALMKSAMPKSEKTALAVLGCLAGAGLSASWLLASTLGDNNDLALRAVLPAALILIAVAAAGIWRAPRRALIAAAALGGLVLTLPNSFHLIRSDFVGNDVPDAGAFAQSPQLWAAVRRIAPPTARIANDPLFLQDLTPWPVNMSWALLADRSSCFAGRELAIAFAPLPAARRKAINRQFIRVFAGQGTQADVSEMAERYDCGVIVLVPQDKAWDRDPFAASPDYRLADNRAGRWRIYVKNTTPRAR